MSEKVEGGASSSSHGLSRVLPYSLLSSTPERVLSMDEQFWSEVLSMVNSC